MTANEKRTEITAYLQKGCDRSAAEENALRLGIKAESEIPENSTSPLLMFDDNGLFLMGDGLCVYGDFTKMLPRLKKANLSRELLVRTAKIKRTEEIPSAIDATAGLGEDSLLLAAAGYSVTMYEYNPVIAVLLENALYRAAKLPELSEIVARMRLIEADCINALPRAESKPSVVYLDPMFPRRQKSALVKKKFQLLHYLEQPCADEAALLRAAIAASPEKIIIKRPVKAPFLAGIKPGYSISGDGIRFDCIVNTANSI